MGKGEWVKRFFTTFGFDKCTALQLYKKVSLLLIRSKGSLSFGRKNPASDVKGCSPSQLSPAITGISSMGLFFRLCCDNFSEKVRVLVCNHKKP